MPSASTRSFVRAAARDLGALPLLSFLLDQLWQRRTNNGTLTFVAYNELGGLEGALGRRAEEVFCGAAIQPTFKLSLPIVLRALVSVGMTATKADGERAFRTAVDVPTQGSPGAHADRSIPWTTKLACWWPTIIFQETPSGRPGASSRATNKPEALVRVAHEALLSHWPRAKAQEIHGRQSRSRAVGKTGRRGRSLAHIGKETPGQSGAPERTATGGGPGTWSADGAPTCPQRSGSSSNRVDVSRDVAGAG